MMLSIPTLLLVVLVLTSILTFMLFSVHTDSSDNGNKHDKVSLSKRLSKKRSYNKASRNVSYNRTTGKVKSKRMSIYGRADSLRVSTVHRDIPVYMDWFLSSDSFTYINYKSLESVLSAYPHSTIKIIHVGPMSADYYKVGDLISKHFCMKYQKMGYTNLVVDVQGYNKRIEVPFAQSYFDEAIDICCKVFKTSDIKSKKDVPFHLIMYFRLLNLYEQIGLFTDFTWFHKKESADYFSTVQNGVMMVPSCDNVSLKCFTSMIMIFQDNVIPKCMLLKYEKDDDFVTCIKSDIANGGTECIKKAFIDCFARNHVMNEFLFTSALMNNQEKSQRIWNSNIESDKQYNNFVAIWLGKKSLSGKWILPTNTSTLSSLIRSDLNLSKHDEMKFIQSQQSKGLNCSLQRATCRNYNMTTLPKLGKYTNSSMVQAALSCTMNFALAGFMKSGSTFLYNTIAQHPQVVKLLRGVGFKESGCYLPEAMYGLKAIDRMNCFPFIEKNDNFYFGDGTVYYAIRKETPYYLVSDNPDIKAIFVVRDPITRALSHHRFSYVALKSRGLGNMNDIARLALNESTKGLYDLYPLAMHALEVPVGEERTERIEKLMTKYQSGLLKHDTLYRRACNIFIHSLYFMPIYHWSKVLKKGNVLVIAAEQLDPKKTDPIFKKKSQIILRPTPDEDSYDSFNNMKNKTFVSNMNRIFDFLGLCPLSKVSIVDAHGTKEEAPNEDGLDNETRERMREFYRPFNQLLYDFLHEEFPYQY